MHRKLKDKITMRSFIIYLNFVSLLAVCLFACNHHSSNPMLQQVDSLLEMKPDSALTILKNISVLEDLPEVDKAYYALLLAEATEIYLSVRLISSCREWNMKLNLFL